MNDVIKSGNIIKKIRDGKQLEEIAFFARNCIFRDGPKDALVLEILSYLKLFQPTFFEKSLSRHASRCCFRYVSPTY